MKLNVLLITYNHSKFIKQTLETIIMQKTNFDFNIIVADDKSTDDTMKIIKEFQKSTDMEFIYLDNKKNHGITKNYKRAFKACDAEYVAIMEGDDLWTSPYRLQKHIDFLDEHYECVMSFNRYIVSNFDKSNYTIQPHWAGANWYELVTSRNLATDNFIGNFSTCVYRSAELKKLPEDLFELTAYDWITNIMVGRNGMIGYLTEIMNSYRIHEKGSWSSKTEEENSKELIKNIDIYNEFTNKLYNDEFSEYKNRINSRLITLKSIKVANIQNVSGIRRKLSNIKSLLPPFIIWIIKGIVPPKILNKIIK